MSLKLFDTHTHFDVPDFDHDRVELAAQAKAVGVEALILIGFVEARFQDLIKSQQMLNSLACAPKAYLAPGLHPFYIEEHIDDHLQQLEQILKTQDCVAIGEIGLDQFLKQHKQAEMVEKQKAFFNAQIELAKQYHKPILLHIRKSHAEVLQLLKAQRYQHGGIAHAFGGGVQEAKAFTQLGFKLGVTGQVTNPNAKKLHQVIETVGAEHLVLETDCPDMTPLCCQTGHGHTRNTPANLPYVLDALADRLAMPKERLSQLVWNNSLAALHLA